MSNLQVELTFSTGVLRGHEAAPIAQDGTMFIITPYPNNIYAMDLTKPGEPTKWSCKSEPVASAQALPAAMWSIEA